MALIKPAPLGHWLDAQTGGYTATWYERVAQKTPYQGIIFDVWANTLHQDLQRTLAAGLGFMAFQGYWIPAWSQPKQATERAKRGIDRLSKAGFHAPATVYLDCESMDIDAKAAMAWVDAWAAVVTQAGYQAGVYVGPGCPLSGKQWWERPQITTYWKSESKVPGIPHRGYAVLQEQGNARVNGETVDLDVVHADHLGNRPLAQMPETLTAVRHQVRRAVTLLQDI